MPSWHEVLLEIKEHQLLQPTPLDHVRREYLKQLHNKVDRNVITYYSGWLQKTDLEGSGLNDNDMNSFMITVKDLDPTKGLDLIIHTPGGDMAATEAIVDYLHSVFKEDIRAIIPHIAMSAGTMLACACKHIIMGKHSSLGPIDPQFGGIPAYGVLQEFDRAKKEVKKDPSTALLWQLIIRKYHPTFVGECENALDWAEEIVYKWLREHMFAGFKNRDKLAKDIVKHLSDHDQHKHHTRHINFNSCKDIGLRVLSIEDDFDEQFQDLIFTIHRIYMYTFSHTPSLKIAENHIGEAMVHYVES